MDAKTFEDVFKSQVERCDQVLLAKAREYADAVDRLKNFKISAAVKNETPLKALEGMMVKHTVSLYEMLSSGEEYSKAIWDEKITDHMNYLFLLQGLLAEERANQCVSTGSNELAETMDGVYKDQERLGYGNRR